MGSLSPASLVLTGLSALNSGVVPFAQGLAQEQQQREAIRASQDLALAQLKAQQKLQNRQLKQDAELDRARVLASAEEAESQRKAALKRAVARQNAQFGSSGVSRDGGSSEAVLLGLFEESEDERKEREKLDNLRLKAIDLNVSGNKQKNILEATQAAQQRQLESLF